jgi:hypothetical protein
MADDSFPGRRANTRFALFAEVEVTLAGGTSLPAQLSSLSSLGCYIHTLEPIPIGTELRLRISHGTGVCEVQAKVIYIHSADGQRLLGIGLLFENMTSGQHSVINTWLQELACKRARPSRS